MSLLETLTVTTRYVELLMIPSRGRSSDQLRKSVNAGRTMSERLRKRPS